MMHGHHALLQVFDEPALVKAKASVAKSGCFERREPLWIQRLYPPVCRGLPLPWSGFCACQAAGVGDGTVEQREA